MDEAVVLLTNIPWWLWVLIVLVLIAVYDIVINKKHTILHNFRVVGHLDYSLENIGPEFRQYIVAGNREELPFNCIERGWVYASSKKTLAETFTYNKTKVPFDSVATLVGCPNLGGSYRKGQETDVKEVATEDTSVSEQ